MSSARPAPPITTLLERSPPLISATEAIELARQHFHVTGRVTLLSAERDCNYRLETDKGDLLLKISNAGEDPAAVDAQTGALLHIAVRDPSLPVPRVLRTMEGATVLLWHRPEGTLRVRLLSFLPGTPLHLSPSTTAQRQSVGAGLAQLALALEDFDHPGARRPLLWDVSRAGELHALLPYIADVRYRALAQNVLDRFERYVVPSLPGLRRRVLHNDFNPHNLLVDPENTDKLAGIIDFGDMVHAPLVNDLATAAAYFVPADAHPLAYAADMVTAYHRVNRLRPEEIDLLFDLIATRQAVSVIINTWRAGLQPENRDYILRNSPAAWRGVERFAQLDRAEAQSIFRAACGMTQA